MKSFFTSSTYFFYEFGGCSEEVFQEKEEDRVTHHMDGCYLMVVPAENETGSGW